MIDRNTVLPFILYGGSGTRLRPLSRKSFPKQFVPLIGNTQPVKLMTFIDTIESDLGIETRKKFLTMQVGDDIATYADVEALRQDIGFASLNLLEASIAKWAKSIETLVATQPSKLDS